MIECSSTICAHTQTVEGQTAQIKMQFLLNRTYLHFIYIQLKQTLQKALLRNNSLYKKKTYMGKKTQ